MDKANSPHVGPGPMGGMSSVVAILRDPNPYLGEFRKKTAGKLRKARSTSVTKD